MNGNAAIEVEDLTYSYDDEQRLLERVSFSVPENSIVTVLGKNGVGKTTLLNCLLGLNRRYSGTVRIFGRDIREHSRKELARTIGLVPQLSQVSFDYTVDEFVLLGTAPQLGYFSVPNRDEKHLVDRALDMLGISQLKHRFVNSLSGGERQLVYIARTIVQRPRILVMDEPTSALDFGNSIAITDLIGRLRDDGYTIILTCHDPDLSFFFHGYTVAMFPQNRVVLGRSDELLSDEVLSQLYGVGIQRVFLPENERYVCIKRP